MAILSNYWQLTYEEQENIKCKLLIPREEEEGEEEGIVLVDLRDRRGEELKRLEEWNSNARFNNL